MDIVLHPTDKLIKRSRLYILRKKFLRPSYIVIILSISTIFILRNVLREIPPNNVIRRISYRRNKVNIFLEPETVKKKPVYQFGKLSENRYFLDIFDSKTRVEYNRSYDYGGISHIDQQQINPQKTQITFTFTSLKDEPEVSYFEDPPHFKLHFNKYLDDKFIVVIDPGHGGENTGAIGQNGSLEKDITLDIALRLNHYLSQKEDIQGFLTRKEDEDVELYERRRMSDFWDADLFLSIHANHAPNKKVNQTEIYYSSNHSYSPARIIRDELRKTLNIGRGIIRRRGFVVIRRNPARLGAVLVETMYLSNVRGEKYLTSTDHQDIIARSLFSSIDKIMSQAE